jgi:5-methyltetrahydropteroyltriglutamate--homocysteine methyltransferase
MQPGTRRILTTHSGSLPRPAGFLPLVMAREAGEPADEAQYDDEVRAAVRETVRRQADAGVDVLNDGEMSKPSYATYVKDRLTGVGGEGAIEQVAASVMGLDDFPDFAEKMAQTMASAAAIRFTSCDGPVRYVGQGAVRADIDCLKAAAQGVGPAGLFMTAASPGVIAVFSPNRYYPSQEEYLGAVAEAMKVEYEAIHRAGLVLQLIRYAEVVGRDRVMAGTDCGFGTIAGMDAVVPTVTWAKFRSQAEGARIASEHLWGAAA